MLVGTYRQNPQNLLDDLSKVSLYFTNKEAEVQYGDNILLKRDYSTGEAFLIQESILVFPKGTPGPNYSALTETLLTNNYT